MQKIKRFEAHINIEYGMRLDKMITDWIQQNNVVVTSLSTHYISSTEVAIVVYEELTPEKLRPRTNEDGA